jgi:hypothetical protein
VKPAFGINLTQWHIWESEHFDGIEIWSYMHDWVDNLTPVTMPYYYLRPDRAIDGPDRRVLGLWDRLNLHRRVAGVGALDAHAVKMLFGAFVAFPYERLFKTILTHATVERWGDDADADTAELRAALKSARAFVAYDALSASDGFEFRTSDGMMTGDRAPYEAGLKIEVRAAARAELRLVRNGRSFDAREGTAAEFAAEGPGVYRAEAYLGGRPWVFSNPIVLI